MEILYQPILGVKTTDNQGVWIMVTKEELEAMEAAKIALESQIAQLQAQAEQLIIDSREEARQIIADAKNEVRLMWQYYEPPYTQESNQC